MQADCPSCRAEMSVEYEDGGMRTCACSECGARFEVEADGDWTGDHWQDQSVPGKVLVGGPDGE